MVHRNTLDNQPEFLQNTADRLPTTAYDIEGALTVSDHAATATPATESSPDFDHREVAMFGQDDTKAISVIGKMLVGFFFYSLIAMSVVAIWTIVRGGQANPHAASASHGDADD
jgi:hypothetical protein